MTQAEKARYFAELHVKGRPLVLYNIWDAGSARAVTEAGAPAVATGSWSVAAAQGFPDGEAIPLELVEIIIRRIVSAVEVPVSVDFERGYGEAPAEVAVSAARIVKAGAIGINLEDGLAGEDTVRDIPGQCARIRAIREEAEKLGVPLFINARTDLFLQMRDRSQHARLTEEAATRAEAYAAAGADGFFAPGLVDEDGIENLCRASVLPVNILAMGDVPPIARLAALGAGRVSFGPLPYISLMGMLKSEAEKLYAAG